MQFYFIRHAQSTNNALWDVTRSSSGRDEDPELTGIGLEQARLLAGFLKTGNPLGGRPTPGFQTGFRLTHLYCSLMARSAATGWIASQALGIPLEALEDVHEEGGSTWKMRRAGSGWASREKTGTISRVRTRGYGCPRLSEKPAGGTTGLLQVGEARVERAHRFVTALLEKHGSRPDRVAVISHGGFTTRSWQRSWA